MHTPDRQINPPSFYEKDKPIKEQCTICKEYTTDELTLVRLPYKNIKIKEFMCNECLKDHEDNTN